MAFKHTFKYLKSTADGIKEIEETQNLSPAKAIRFNCLDCSGGNLAEVKGCHLTKCPLWPFRMGKSGPKREMSAEQREIASERMRQIRKKTDFS